MNDRPSNAFAAAVLIGLVAYVACIVRHWCQCGHMMHKEYLAWWDYLIDGAWIACFAVGAVLAVARWRFRGIVLATLLAVLFVSRLWFAGTMGLSVVFCELPISLYLLVKSSLTLFDRLIGGPPAERTPA